MPAGSQPGRPALTVPSPSSVTGTRKMEYKGSSWHETCFVCHHCQRPIGTQSFIPKDSENLCLPCYEQQYAPQCVQCRKVGRGGVWGVRALPLPGERSTEGTWENPSARLLPEHSEHRLLPVHED